VVLIGVDRWIAAAGAQRQLGRPAQPGVNAVVAPGGAETGRHRGVWCAPRASGAFPEGGSLAGNSGEFWGHSAVHPAAGVPRSQPASCRDLCARHHLHGTAPVKNTCRKDTDQ
jgi:hypothetical protein